MFARLYFVPQQAGAKAVLTVVCCWSFLSLTNFLPTAVAAESAGPDTVRQTNSVTTDKVTGNITMRIDREKTIKIETNMPVVTTCQATIELSYQQRNTLANVEGVIENPMCAASSGDYELAVSIKDPNGGDPKILEFTAKWQRSDNKAIKFSSDYPIGENAELLRVRARKVHCTCNDGAAN